MAKKLINRLTRTETQQNSKVEPDVLRDYSVGAFLTDEENRTLWVNGMPYGNAYISSSATRQPKHAEVFNDFDRNKAEGHYSHAEGGAYVNTVYNNAKITKLETPITIDEVSYKYSVPYTSVINKMIGVMTSSAMNIPLYTVVNNEGRLDPTTTEELVDSDNRITDIADTPTGVNVNIDSTELVDITESPYTTPTQTKYYIVNSTVTGNIIYFNVATAFNSAVTTLPEYCDGKTMYFHYYYAYDGKDGWSEATKDGAHAEGISQAHGVMSHSEGFANRSYEDYSHTEGIGNEVYGLAAHAEGDRNIVTNSAPYSHVEGHMNIAKADSVHVEGRNNLGNNTGAHVEGGRNIVNGIYGHAEGYGNTVNNDYGHAEGVCTKVTNIGEHAEGRYNVSEPGYISSIGIGIDTTPKNAITVMNDGRIYIAGTIENIKNLNKNFNPCNYNGIVLDNSAKSIQQILSENEEKLENITYAKLIYYIDNNALTPGKLYRIIDYFTSVYNSTNIKSAYHIFDIIVFATTKNTIDERAYAVLPEYINNEYYLKLSGSESVKYKIFNKDNINTFKMFKLDNNGLTTSENIYIESEENNTENYFNINNFEVETKNITSIVYKLIINDNRFIKVIFNLPNTENIIVINDVKNTDTSYIYNYLNLYFNYNSSITCNIYYKSNNDINYTGAGQITLINIPFYNTNTNENKNVIFSQSNPVIEQTFNSINLFNLFTLNNYNLYSFINGNINSDDNTFCITTKIYDNAENNVFSQFCFLKIIDIFDGNPNLITDTYITNTKNYFNNRKLNGWNISYDYSNNYNILNNENILSYLTLNTPTNYYYSNNEIALSKESLSYYVENIMTLDKYENNFLPFKGFDKNEILEYAYRFNQVNPVVSSITDTTNNNLCILTNAKEYTSKQDSSFKAVLCKQDKDTCINTPTGNINIDIKDCNNCLIVLTSIDNIINGKVSDEYYLYSCFIDTTSTNTILLPIENYIHGFNDVNKTVESLNTNLENPTNVFFAIEQMDDNDIENNENIVLPYNIYPCYCSIDNLDVLSNSIDIADTITEVRFTNIEQPTVAHIGKYISYTENTQDGENDVAGKLWFTNTGITFDLNDINSKYAELINKISAFKEQNASYEFNTTTYSIFRCLFYLDKTDNIWKQLNNLEDYENLESIKNNDVIKNTAYTFGVRLIVAAITSKGNIEIVSNDGSTKIFNAFELNDIETLSVELQKTIDEGAEHGKLTYTTNEISFAQGTNLKSVEYNTNRYGNKKVFGIGYNARKITYDNNDYILQTKTSSSINTTCGYVNVNIEKINKLYSINYLNANYSAYSNINVDDKCIIFNYTDNTMFLPYFNILFDNEETIIGISKILSTNYNETVKILNYAETDNASVTIEENNIAVFYQPQILQYEYLIKISNIGDTNNYNYLPTKYIETYLPFYYSRGYIKSMTDEYNNTANYDLTNYMFRYNNGYYYTFSYQNGNNVFDAVELGTIRNNKLLNDVEIYQSIFASKTDSLLCAHNNINNSNIYIVNNYNGNENSNEACTIINNTFNNSILNIQTYSTVENNIFNNCNCIDTIFNTSSGNSISDITNFYLKNSIISNAINKGLYNNINNAILTDLTEFDLPPIVYGNTTITTMVSAINDQYVLPSFSANNFKIFNDNTLVGDKLKNKYIYNTNARTIKNSGKTFKTKLIGPDTDPTLSESTSLQTVTALDQYYKWNTSRSYNRFNDLGNYNKNLVYINTLQNETVNKNFDVTFGISGSGDTIESTGILGKNNCVDFGWFYAHTGVQIKHCVGGASKPVTTGKFGMNYTITINGYKYNEGSAKQISETVTEKIVDITNGNTTANHDKAVWNSNDSSVVMRTMFVIRSGFNLNNLGTISIKTIDKINYILLDKGADKFIIGEYIDNTLTDFILYFVKYTLSLSSLYSKGSAGREYIGNISFGQINNSINPAKFNYSNFNVMNVYASYTTSAFANNIEKVPVEYKTITTPQANNIYIFGNDSLNILSGESMRKMIVEKDKTVTAAVVNIRDMFIEKNIRDTENTNNTAQNSILSSALRPWYVSKSKY